MLLAEAVEKDEAAKCVEDLFLHFVVVAVDEPLLPSILLHWFCVTAAYHSFFR